MNDIYNAEEDFHDAWAGSVEIEDVMVDEFFEACTSPENRIVMNMLGDVKGKRILELGCGMGEASVYFAKKGADVVATDISDKMLQVVKKVAERHNVTLQTRQCLSDKIDYDSETLDIVYAANLLHHVDIQSTVAEASRVLKKGGIFVSWDPLAYNPLINIYRGMASKVRTEHEHPLKMNDLDIFRKYFSQVKFDVAWFLTLWIFVKFYLFDRIHPNEKRYWKKILEDHRKLEKTYKKLERLDRLVLKLFPFLKRYCWNIVIFSIK